MEPQAQTLNSQALLLMRHFFKMDIFKKSKYEELEIVNVLSREIFISKEVILLEKEYLAHNGEDCKRENNYKIYTWGHESGLHEIKLVADKNEGKLIDLIAKHCKESPTHIVIAQKRDWSKGDNDDYSQEYIAIYPCQKDQQKIISQWIQELKK